MIKNNESNSIKEFSEFLKKDIVKEIFSSIFNKWIFTFILIILVTLFLFIDSYFGFYYGSATLTKWYHAPVDICVFVFPFLFLIFIGIILSKIWDWGI